MPSAADFIPPKSREKIYAWIIELSSPETREAALLELSKKREVAVKTEVHVKNSITFEIIALTTFEIKLIRSQRMDFLVVFNLAPI